MLYIIPLDAGFRHLFYEDNWALPKDGIGAFPDSYGFNAVCAPVQIERARTHSQPTKENEPTSARGSNPMFRARSGACEEIASMPSQTAL